MKTVVRLAMLALLAAFVAAGTAGAGEATKPMTSDEWRKKGVEAFNAKDYQNAVVYFRKTLELNPKDAKAYSDLGLVSYNKGDNEGAERYYSMAIDLKPSDSTFLSHVYYNRFLAVDSQHYRSSQALKDLQMSAKLGFQQARDNLTALGLRW